MFGFLVSKHTINNKKKKQLYQQAVKFSLADAKRKHLSEDELCDFTWRFRFKKCAGEHWIEQDAYWQGLPPVTVIKKKKQQQHIIIVVIRFSKLYRYREVLYWNFQITKEKKNQKELLLAFESFSTNNHNKKKKKVKFNKDHSVVRSTGTYQRR